MTQIECLDSTLPIGRVIYVQSSRTDRLDEIVRQIGMMHDEDIEYMLRTMERLDFDRLRRMANWLIHRRLDRRKR